MDKRDDSQKYNILQNKKIGYYLTSIYYYI